MPTLLDYGPSATCLEVRILLRQLGIEDERVEVDIFAGESRTPEYLSLNPAVRTPALRLDDGRALAESNATPLFLAEGSELLPAGRVELGHVHQWLFFEQNLLEPNLARRGSGASPAPTAGNPTGAGRCPAIRSPGPSAPSPLI
jgi:glutathione S-transferase